ncbi:hypothetical protein PR048_000873 [Dryococelus australis]|uniref:Uncharacterized protein n=1 Tax=Dryococelus australis TaxID=614101 RepID=A0ABQ9IGE9_9NEOP|nr:hypothetical protein PR048_000873 [Dryococelus australis]
MNELEGYWKKWAIKVNPTKSALIIFHRGRYDMKLNLRKYQKKDNQQHITIATNVVTGKFLQAYPLFKSSKLATKTKGMLHRAKIRAAMLYTRDSSKNISKETANNAEQNTEKHTSSNKRTKVGDCLVWPVPVVNITHECYPSRMGLPGTLKTGKSPRTIKGTSKQIHFHNN